MRPSNLASRAGRWSAQHRRIAILGWIAFVIAATVGGGMIGTNSLSDSEMGNGSSKAADLAVDKAGFRESSGEQVLLQARSRDGSRAALQAAAAQLVQRLDDLPHVEQVVSPFDADATGQVSEDGRSALLSFEIAGDDDKGSSTSTRRSRPPRPSSERTRTCASSRSAPSRRARRSRRRSRTTSSAPRRCRCRSR